MSAPFQVSDKVVCLDARGTARNFSPAPVEGRVYVVTRCEPATPDGWPDGALEVVGVKGKTGVSKSGHETSWVLNPNRFRLLYDVQAENATQAHQRKGEK